MLVFGARPLHQPDRFQQVGGRAADLRVDLPGLGLLPHLRPRRRRVDQRAANGLDVAVCALDQRLDDVGVAVGRGQHGGLDAPDAGAGKLALAVDEGAPIAGAHRLVDEAAHEVPVDGRRHVAAAVGRQDRRHRPGVGHGLLGRGHGEGRAGVALGRDPGAEVRRGVVDADQHRPLHPFDRIALLDEVLLVAGGGRQALAVGAADGEDAAVAAVHHAIGTDERRAVGGRRIAVEPAGVEPRRDLGDLRLGGGPAAVARLLAGEARVRVAVVGLRRDQAVELDDRIAHRHVCPGRRDGGVAVDDAGGLERAGKRGRGIRARSALGPRFRAWGRGRRWHGGCRGRARGAAPVFGGAVGVDDVRRLAAAGLINLPGLRRGPHEVQIVASETNDVAGPAERLAIGGRIARVVANPAAKGGEQSVHLAPHRRAPDLTVTDAKREVVELGVQCVRKGDWDRRTVAAHHVTGRLIGVREHGSCHISHRRHRGRLA